MMRDSPDFISLKEAAQLSGYSSDYIGQLIRAGKISGKQVYSNVAWVTTREAVLGYLEKDAKKKTSATVETVADGTFSLEAIMRMYAVLAALAIGIVAAFVLFLGYVMAVSIDHRIEATHLERAEEHARSMLL